MKQWLVFTDLDGTLLDHDDYSFDAASESLRQLRSLGIPLILASSKTRVEMEMLSARLGNSYPFICENGAAICCPGGDGWEVEPMAPERGQVLSVLAQLRESEAYLFSGFNDMSIAQICAETGLDPAAAALASQREYSEPLLWADTDARLEKFLEQLAGYSLQASQGGRFLSVAGICDKASAMQRLGTQLGEPGQNWIIALGDSPNDQTMLAAADVAVVVASARSEKLQLPASRRVIRTRAAGPSGWHEAMSALLQEHTSMTGDI